MTPVTDLTQAKQWLRDAELALSAARRRLAAGLPEGLYAAQLDQHVEKLIAGTAFLIDELTIRLNHAGRPPQSG